MGLGEVDGSSEKGSTDEIYCSICLDVVRFGGGRSTAKLECGHVFHLDCIGSAFNAKGVMQCPNCRVIGKGNWLYSKGSRSLPERNFDEGAHAEDPNGFNYSEMLSRVRWCPFSRLAWVLPSFEDGETSAAISFQNAISYHAMFTGDSATSSASHQCPYVAYMPSLQPSSSLNPTSSTEGYDGPTNHCPWSHVSSHNEVRTPHVLPAGDHHYHNWERHSPINSQPSSNSSSSTQEMDSSATVRAARLDLDGVRTAVPPVHRFVPGHGSSSRSPGPFMAAVAPAYSTNSQSYPHVHEHYQHHNPMSMPGAVFSSLPPSGARGPHAGGPHPLRDPMPYYLFPPTSRNWWGLSPHTTGLTDSGNLWGFWHGNGFDSPSSQ